MVHVFIVNPFAGNMNFAEELRSRLNKLQGIEYYIFNTRYAGYEQEMVKRILNIFEGEKIRIYCCGGSGTMRNILDGYPDLSEAEVAFYPCGLTNDFLKMFGHKYEFNSIEHLIYGDVIKIDYIKTNAGVCLNTLSLGIDANMSVQVENSRILSFLGQQVPYVVGAFQALFMSAPDTYEIYVEDKRYLGRFGEVAIGNGNVLGGRINLARTGSICDGEAEFLIAPDRQGFGILPLLVTSFKGNMEKLSRMSMMGRAESFSIKRRDGGTMIMNMDGELVKCTGRCNITVVKQGLSFVVPKDVTWK